MKAEFFSRPLRKKRYVHSLVAAAALGFLLQTDGPKHNYTTDGPQLAAVNASETTVDSAESDNHFIIEYPETSTSAKFLQTLEDDGVSVADSGAVDEKASDIQVHYAYKNIPFIALTTNTEDATTEIKEHALSWIADSGVKISPVAESDKAMADDIANLEKYIGSDVAAAYSAEGEGVTTEIIGTGIDLRHPFMTGISDSQSCYSENGLDRRSICPSGETEEHSKIAGTSVERSYQKGAHETAAASAYRMISKKSIIKPTMVGLEMRTPDGWYSSLTHAVLLAALDNADADVVSLSIGTTELYTEPCNEANTLTRAYSAITQKLVQKGMVLSLSAANSSTYGGAAPGCTTADGAIERDGIMTIAALDNGYHGLASFSSRAPWTTLAAPGEHIPLADTVSLEWIYGNGTSFATPIVAAAAANLLSKFPDLTPQQVEYLLWKHGTIYQVPYANDKTAECGMLTVVGINLSNSVVREILARAEQNHTIFLTLAVKKR